MPRELVRPDCGRSRTPLLALLAGGIAAGFGLGALGLALVLPAPIAAPLPPLGNHALQPAAVIMPQARIWPEAFGTPSAPEIVQWEPPEEEAYEVTDDDYIPNADHSYRLRGVVTQAIEPGESPETDDWALIESNIGTELVRVSSMLSGGETVLKITRNGVLLQGIGTEFLLSFSDDCDCVEIDGSGQYYYSDVQDEDAHNYDLLTFDYSGNDSVEDAFELTGDGGAP